MNLLGPIAVFVVVGADPEVAIRIDGDAHHRREDDVGQNEDPERECLDGSRFRPGQVLAGVELGIAGAGRENQRSATTPNTRRVVRDRGDKRVM